MSSDHTTGEVKFHLFSNLQLEAFGLGDRLYDPERVLLRARRIDVKGFAKNGALGKGEKESKG